MIDKKIAVVVLNWNGAKLLEQFLPSVVAYSDEAKIYVADNASSDNSIAFIKEKYPTITIIKNDGNYGFAKGYNLALEQVEEEYYALVNSDIEVTKNWLAPILSIFDTEAKIGIIQPKILDYKNKEYFEYAGAAGGFIDQYGYPYCRGRIFETIEKDNGQYDDSLEIFWASGACFFIRKEVYRKLNGFDDDFFAHQEEIDLCWRLQLAGHRIMSCPASIIYHIGGGTLAKNNPKKIYLNFRNNLIMLWKNLEGIDAFMTVSFRFLLDAISAWKNLLSGQSYFFTAVMKAHFGFFSWLLVNQKKSIFPSKRIAKPAGRYMGSVVWQHFAKGKNRFSEIVENCS